MRALTIAALIALPFGAAASEESRIQATIEGIAIAADAQDWDRLDVKFADHVILNKLSLATDQGARVQEQTVVEAWADLIPRFDTTLHDVSEIEILAVTSVIAKATARYSATYQLGTAVWQQTGRLDYLLKNSPSGWQVTAMNTTPEWENQPLSAVLGTCLN